MTHTMHNPGNPQPGKAIEGLASGEQGEADRARAAGEERARRVASCPDAEWHRPPMEACGFPGCGWHRDDPVAGVVLPDAAAEQVDPPGTCHLVGCPEKGRHAPHPIGCPDDFTPYQQPSAEPRKVLVLAEDLELILDLYGGACLAGRCTEDEHQLLTRLHRTLATAGNGG